jgi:hypothetical protein
MANPFEVKVPSIFEALLAGDKGYETSRAYRRENQQDAARQAASKAMMGGADNRSVLAQLIGAGLTPEAAAISNMDLARSNADWTKTYQGGMLDVAKQNATRQEVPAQLQILKASGIDPASPEGRKALFPKTDTPISATDKKAIFEAEDAQPQIMGTIDALKRALELNDKTYTGYGAEFYGNLGTKAAGAIGIKPSDQSVATTEWSKLMSSEALQSMANTLKGATTDFELRKFTEMLADPSTDPSVRKSVIGRMMTLAERQQKINEARIKDLRGGDYFKPGQNPTAQQPAKPAAPQMPQGAKQAKDGNYYVPDPQRPGKYLMVQP